MKKLNLKTLGQELKIFNKIIVTGPPRSGTTVAGLIIATELGYKFIDESWYDANNSQKFMFMFSLPRKMVIHTTAFLRDLHIMNKFLDLHNIPIILIRRRIGEILESFENSKNFKTGISTSNGIFTCIDEEAQKILFNHYGYKNGCKKRTLPEVIYSHFYKHKCELDENKLFELKYEDLKKHRLFVEKSERRKYFNHIKQVKINDPYYLKNQKGIMVL